MSTVFLVVVAVLILAYSSQARRLERWNLSAPMFFIAAGVVFFAVLSPGIIGHESIRLIAELTLVVVLFHDASSIRLSALRSNPWIPIRLLAIGFPLAVLATFGAVQWVIPSLGLAGALLLAGSITPTDAGLGAPTVMNPAVPARIRRALNVESGLNDGLATPIVLIALAALVAEEGAETEPVLQVALVPLLLAFVVAGIGGFAAAVLVERSQLRESSSGRGRAIMIVATPLVLWGVAELIGANGFIAAFLGGLVFGTSSKCLHEDRDTSALLETTADLLSYVIWFLAGEMIVITLRAGFDWRWLVIAVLALTVLRIVPVLISLIGSGLRLPSQLFIGWFGPRGLATIVFALLAVEELGTDSPLVLNIVGVTSATVLLSVVAHGITAKPLADRYSKWSRTNDPHQLNDQGGPLRSRGQRAQKHT